MLKSDPRHGRLGRSLHEGFSHRVVAGAVLQSETVHAFVGYPLGSKERQTKNANFWVARVPPILTQTQNDSKPWEPWEGHAADSH